MTRQAAFEQRLFGGPCRIRWSPADVRRIAAKFGVADGAAFVAKRPQPSLGVPGAKTVKTSAGQKAFTFVISTPSVDRYGDTIAVEGWHLAQYRKNPVVLWAHDSDLVPVGAATAVRVEGRRLVSTMAFAPSGIDAQAARVQGMVEHGILRACSVGFMPIEWEWSNDPNRPYGIDFAEQELLEWSICSVPANPDCLLVGIDESGGNTAGKSKDQVRRQRDLELVRMRGGRTS